MEKNKSEIKMDYAGMIVEGMKFAIIAGLVFGLANFVHTLPCMWSWCA